MYYYCKQYLTQYLFITLFSGILMLSLGSCTPTKQQTDISDFNSDWQFSLSSDSTATSLEFDDSDWKTIQLPHDWSVEFPFDSVNGEGATGYLPGGIGWYRKHFQISPQSDSLAYILFDGVYNNAEFWINGKKLGDHPYGYSPFYFDITPFLAENGENILTVKVDRSRYADSRWYSGSGIYREVRLVRIPQINIPVWGTFITTPEVSAGKAVINVQTQIHNLAKIDKEVSLITQIYAPNGEIVTELSEDLAIQADKEHTQSQQIEIKNPQRWDLNAPHIYQAVSQIIDQGIIIQEYKTNFGIRDFRFDKDQGFFLNGINHKIKGVCLHHDGGLVGAAVPVDIWRRRLKTLKEGGCNAIRISHNPGSEEFLSLCDEMGFLVQDEFFDEWDYPKDKRLNMNERSVDYITRGYGEHFQEWAEKDLKNTVLAHRNHPSIIQWSIGNEIEWTYPKEAASTGFFDPQWSGNYFWSEPPHSIEKIKELQQSLPKGEYNIGTTAKKLASWTRELDTTRPIIANCILPSASYESGYADALDMIGFSYRRVMYDYGHQNYPDLPLMGTENLGQYHEWKAIMERPFVAGTFLWTGIDYIGESNQGWPRKAGSSGLLDLAGFTKPSYYMMRSLWSDEPTLYMTTQTHPKSIFTINQEGKVVEKKPGAWEKALWAWHPVNRHWNYQNGDTVIVEIISNAPEVELFLDDKSLGTKKLANFEDHIYKWAVPFVEGKLQAKALINDQEISTVIATASAPSAIELSVDKKILQVGSRDVTHLEVQLVDEEGRPVRNQEKEITINVSEKLTLLGVDNGAPDNVQPFQGNTITTSQGRALIICQAGTQSGEAIIAVTSSDLSSAKVKIDLR